MTIFEVFRKITPERIAGVELRRARIELMAAERELDKSNSSVAYWKQRIERLSAHAVAAKDLSPPRIEEAA